jgi:hypothetical protein
MRTIAVAVVCLLFCAPAAFAQAFFDVNFLAARSGQGEQVYAIDEPATIGPVRTSIAEGIPALRYGSGVDVDGGLTIAHGFGAAVRVGYTKHDYPIDVGFSMFNPSAVPAVATAIGASNEVKRQEYALDFMLNYMSDIGHHMRVRVFGGPSYFFVEQGVIEKVVFNETYGPSTIHAVEITDLTTRSSNDTAWGYNFGGDVSYFFSKHVGVGGGVRFNRGTVDDVAIRIPGVYYSGLPISFFLAGSASTEDLIVGHTTLAVGIRLR